MRIRLILWLIIALAALVFSSCPLGSNGPETYERIVIDTYEVWVGGIPDTDLVLYDELGTELGSGDATGSAGGRIDTYAEGIAMSSGSIYYIKVYDSDGGASNPYAVRVLSLAVGESPPAAIDPGSFNDTDSPYESDDAVTGGVPDNPADIPLGNANYLNRYLDSSSGDVDWLKLVLP